MEHFDGARLSPNSVRNAVWHALNDLFAIIYERETRAVRLHT